jgi:hypothetical protein
MKPRISLLGLLALGLVLVSACSSTGPKIIERADSLDERPDWAKVTEPSFEENGKKYFLGFVELDSDVSKSAAMNMADEKALSEPTRAFVDEFLDQNQVGEELRQNSVVGQRIISATRGFRVPMPSLTIVKRYWETIVTGEHTSNVRVYSLAEISVPDFEKAKKDSLDRLNGNSEMKKILREVGKKQRDRILGSEKPAENT